MKKTYITPQMEITEMETASMLANSDSIKGLDGTSYGGVDEDGTKDPASRQWNGWDDDEAF
jgi:hypothetical protein